MPSGGAARRSSGPAEPAGPPAPQSTQQALQDVIAADVLHDVQGTARHLQRTRAGRRRKPHKSIMRRIVRVKVLVVAIVCILAYLTFNMAADAMHLKGNIRTVATYVFIGGGLLYLFVTGDHVEEMDDYLRRHGGHLGYDHVAGYHGYAEAGVYAPHLLGG